MSTLIKRLFLCLIGIAGALAAWPFIETVLYFQHIFPSYLLFSAILGMVTGALMAGFFSSQEGILVNKARTGIGMATGALVGCLGGCAGFLVGQGVLFILGNYFLLSTQQFKSIGLPISRTLGWAVLGICVGTAEGIRSRESRKILVGLIGGLAGGAVGGAFLELITIYTGFNAAGRLAGLLAFGLSVGFFYGLVEKNLSYGVVRLLNGKFKGKEFLVNQKRLSIGTDKKCDIVLDSYKEVSGHHADILIKKNNVSLKKKSAKGEVSLNDDKITEKELAINDVIKIGGARFLYKL